MKRFGVGLGLAAVVLVVGGVSWIGGPGDPGSAVAQPAPAKRSYTDLEKAQRAWAQRQGEARRARSPRVAEGSLGSPRGMGKGFNPRLAREPGPSSGSAYRAEAFAADPESYLAQVDPERSRRPLAAAARGDYLRAPSSRTLRLVSGGSGTLEARTRPRAPVSFTSLDGGVFSNGLSYTTVRADPQGVARATFHADASITGWGTVEAASPEAKGMLTYSVYVEAAGSEDPAPVRGVRPPGRGASPPAR